MSEVKSTVISLVSGSIDSYTKTQSDATTYVLQAQIDTINTTFSDYPFNYLSGSFSYISGTLTVYLDNRRTGSSVVRNGLGSYTVSFSPSTHPTDVYYPVVLMATGNSPPASINATVSGIQAYVPLVVKRTSTQFLIWISDNSSDNPVDPQYCSFIVHY